MLAVSGALASDSGGQAWLDSLRRVRLGQERGIEAGAHIEVNAKRVLLAADLDETSPLRVRSRPLLPSNAAPRCFSEVTFEPLPSGFENDMRSLRPVERSMTSMVNLFGTIALPLG
ncbi:hypothetical protein [Sorangium sp. So ce204]|uniref:hypothetical protein n=1 Tax=Sorangium sp. So ce204 TaxID=3133288 RepID=UPI003F62A911